MIRFSVILLFFLFNSISSWSNPLVFYIFDQVWTQLKADESIKPDLQIVNNDALVARYSPSQNIVYISQKAIEVCKNTNDPEASIAFLIGHELAHSIQNQIQKYNIETNFLRFDRQVKTRIALEENADLNGAFTAYLSGYQVQDILSDLIPELYKSYNLMGKSLSGYPSLRERVETTEVLKEKLNKLIELYSIGIHLIEISQEEIAIPFFEELLKEYQSAEVYNNLGVAYASLALDYGGVNYERFVYPLEVEYETRLVKPSIDYDSKDINFELQIKRSEYLKKASGYFERSLMEYPDYDVAKQNLICVLNMMGLYDEAFKMNEGGTDIYSLIRAITLLNQDIDDHTSRDLLGTLRTSEDKVVKDLARVNYDRISCEDVKGFPSNESDLLPLSELNALDNKYVEVVGDAQDHFYKTKQSLKSYLVGNAKGYIEIILDNN